jgi:arylsulfatase A-like enzyme
MDRRRFLHAGIAAAAALVPRAAWAEEAAVSVTPVTTAAAAASAARPNIILAMTDDQGWGDVGYNGHPHLKTPVLDEMARTGLRFDRFYAAAPVCSPTRASCMTGRHPDRCGVFSWGYDMPLEEVTLAEVLRAAGYATGHFGKWHLGGLPGTAAKAPNMNRAQMPTEPGRERHPGNQGFDEWFSYWNFFDLDPDLFVHNGKPVGPLEGEASEIVADRATAWIKRMAAEKRPFLAVVWFGNPHVPHRATEKDKAPYADLPEPMQNYLGELAAIDRAMGTLRQALRDAGLAENTLLWFTSDNGGTGPGNNGNLRGKKGSLWEGGVRVPCVLEWPERIRQPRRTDMPASTSDFFPTVLDLVGVAPPDARPLDGISLRDLIDGRLTERPSPIAFQVCNANGKPTAAALVDNRWKLHFPKGDAAETTLYDLVDDPGESKDIAAEKPDVVAAMRDRLLAWQAGVARSMAGADYPAATRSSKRPG